MKGAASVRVASVAILIASCSGACPRGTVPARQAAPARDTTPLASRARVAVPAASARLPTGSNALRYRFAPVRLGGGGFVTGIVVHPRVPGVVYARTDVGGAYRWDERDQSWQQLVTVDRMPREVTHAPDGELGGGVRSTHAYGVESIAIDPRDPRVVYLALGGWLVRSRDGGRSFVRLGLEVPMGGNSLYRTSGERLAIDPADSRVVYFGSRNRGLFRSQDAGDTWTLVKTLPRGTRALGDDVGVAIVKLDSAGGIDARGRTKRVYASVAGAGVFLSEDAGETWKKIHDAFALDLEVGGGVAWAALREKGVARFSPGRGWHDATPRGRRDIEDVAVDPRNPLRVFAVAEGFRAFFRTLDGGAFWTELGTHSGGRGRERFRSPRIPWVEASTVRDWLSVGELVVDPHQPSRIWFAEGMGVWRSDDAEDTQGAPTFENVSVGIEELVATGIASAKGTTVVTAWDRIGFQFTDPDRFPRAQLGLSRAFSMGTSVDSPYGTGVFAVSVADTRFCCGDGNYSGVSLDAGATWKRFGSIKEMTNTPEKLRFGEIVVSGPDPSNLVWAPRSGENRLYFSTNGGDAWNESKAPGFSNANAHYLMSKRVLAADPVEPRRFYAYGWQPGRVHVSSDGGRSFAPARGALPSHVWHGQLRAEPARSGHLWFCTGSDHRGPRQSRGLYVSSDSGDTFSKVEGVSECWAIGFGRSTPSSARATIFTYAKVGERFGVFRSTDGGATLELCATHPLGLFANVATIAGDPERFGRVFLGYSGNGFVYGDPVDE